MTADITVTQDDIDRLRKEWRGDAIRLDLLDFAEQALTARSEQEVEPDTEPLEVSGHYGSPALDAWGKPIVPTPPADIPEVMEQDFINIISLQSCTHNEFEELRDTASAYHTQSAEITRLTAEIEAQAANHLEALTNLENNDRLVQKMDLTRAYHTQTSEIERLKAELARKDELLEKSADTIIKSADDRLNQYHRITTLEQAMKSLILTAKLLHQNAEGCAVNHHGEDYQLHGLPGWLADAQKDIELAVSALDKAKDTAQGEGESNG